MQRDDAYIVYCDSRMLLDRRAYATWREVQDAYPDYKASLGPWSEIEIVEFLRDDFGSDEYQWPFSRDVIEAFFRSAKLVLSQHVA